MGKMTILGVRGDREDVLDALMRSGAVEIVEDEDSEQIPPTGLAFADNVDTRGRLQRIIDDMRNRFPEADAFSVKKLTVSEEEFTFTEEEETELRGLLNRYEELLGQEEAIKHTKALLNQQIEQLTPWVGIPIDLAVRDTRRTALIYGIFADETSVESFKADMVLDFPLTAVYFLEESQRYPAKTAIVTIKEQLPRVRARLTSCAYHEIPDLPFTGTAEATILSLKKSIEEKEAEAEEVNAQLEAISGSGARFMTYHDYLLVRSEKAEASLKVTDSSYTFFLNVWVPAAQAKKVGRELTENYGVAWSYRDAEKGEETPVKLQNNAFFRAFEVVLEMYGAPSSQEVDPIPVMAPFYMILFGMMLSDVGYGGLLVAGTAFMLFKLKVQGTMRQLSMVLFISGISSIIWGFLFGGFFGDMLTAVTQGKVNFPALWFNPMDSPIKLLIFSMIFGVIHLFFGLALHIRNEWMQGNLIGGLADSVTWYLIIPGLGLMLGGSALSSDPATVALLGQIGQWVALAGAAFGLIFAGHGIRNPIKRLIKGLSALYGITSYLSDILSYSRILALVLSTSVIATVVNMLGMLAGPSFFGYIVFALIGVFGHGLNLALSALSAYVHTSRLQYVELFGKFFSGGGNFWKPFRRNTTYVKIEDEAKTLPPGTKVKREAT